LSTAIGLTPGGSVTVHTIIYSTHKRVEPD